MIPWRCVLCNLINQPRHFKSGLPRLRCYGCGA